jgi:hypothetical protein
MRALCAVLVIATATTAQANPSIAPSEALDRGRIAYDRGDYSAAIDAVRPLLYPSIELSTEEEVVSAHKLLALSYFFVKAEKEAEEEVMSLLALRPNYALDPVIDPPTAVRFFEGVRTRQQDRLKAVQERERKQQLERRAEEHKKAEKIYIERVVERHSRWVAMIPFGVGQSQNNQTWKALTFGVSEAVMGALSIACYLAIDFNYPLNNNLHHYYSAGQQNTAVGLTATQVAAGGVFWGLVIWGIVDAQYFFKAEVVHDQRELTSPPTAKPKISVTPMISPSQWGLGVQGAF